MCPVFLFQESQCGGELGQLDSEYMVFASEVDKLQLRSLIYNHDDLPQPDRQPPLP